MMMFIRRGQKVLRFNILSNLITLRCIGQPLITTMLQATKNLTKFVELMNPSEASVINLSVKSSGALDLFFYLKKGNGIDMFTSLLMRNTLTLSTRDDKYIDFKGTFEGFEVEVTFLKEGGSLDDDIVQLEFPKYPSEVACLREDVLTLLSYDEWFEFVEELRADAINGSINYIERNKEDDLYGFVCGAFSWENTKKGHSYWRAIASRK